MNPTAEYGAADKMSTNVEMVNPRWKGLCKTSGIVALILGTLFLGGIANLWLSLFQDNWLIKLFKLNAGFNAISFDAMRGVNPLDIVILVLAFVMHLGLFVAVRPASKIWSVVAVVQPFLAIVLFIVTGIAGRSAVMGAGLVISCVMLRSKSFSRITAITGISASVLLLLGDFSTAEDSHSSFVAALLGTGYMLLIAWLFLAGQRLLRLEDARTHEVKTI